MKRNSFITVSIAAVVVIFSIIGWKPATTMVPSAVPATEHTLSAGEMFDQYVTSVYQAAGLGEAKLDFNTFKKAVVGYMNLKKENMVAKSLLTIVDFNRASTEKRMWIVDLDSRKLLFNNLVAHGQGSGDNFASNFSNINNTHQSSLGFYVTSEIYQGKHGRSLKLKGLDKGFNDMAESRAIVLHGAEYVSQNFISQHGRLGRSHGCPAVPVELTSKIIDTVKGKSCIYINGPGSVYNSAYLNDNAAISTFVAGVTPVIQAKI